MYFVTTLWKVDRLALSSLLAHIHVGSSLPKVGCASPTKSMLAPFFKPYRHIEDVGWVVWLVSVDPPCPQPHKAHLQCLNSAQDVVKYKISAIH